MSFDVCIKKYRIGIVLLFLCSCSFLFSAGKKEIEPEVIVITEMQDRYAALADKVPAVILRVPKKTTAIDEKIVSAVYEQLSRQMVLRGKMKPVKLDSWLNKVYEKNKAPSTASLFRTITAERYAAPIEGLLSSDLYRIGDSIYLHLDYFSLSGSGYPVSIVRMFKNSDEIPGILTACLSELELRLAAPSDQRSKKRMLVNDFSIVYRKLVTIEGGEFEFVKSPFIELGMTTMRDGDDFMSKMFSYALETTGLFESLHISDLSQYVKVPVQSSSSADFIVDGTVDFTDRVSLMTVTVKDAQTGNIISSFAQPFTDFSPEFLWNLSRDFIARLAESCLSTRRWRVVPPMEAPGRTFYYNNRCIGWNDISFLALPNGLHRIDTGDFTASSLESDPIPSEEDMKKMPITGVSAATSSVNKDINRSFFVYVDDRVQVYTNRNGEYFGNMLQKKDGEK